MKMETKAETLMMSPTFHWAPEATVFVSSETNLPRVSLTKSKMAISLATRPLRRKPLVGVTFPVPSQVIM